MSDSSEDDTNNNEDWMIFDNNANPPLDSRARQYLLEDFPLASIVDLDDSPFFPAPKVKQACRTFK